LATTVQNRGNSLAIRIPKYIAEQVKIEEGSKIEIAAENQSIKIIPLKRKMTLGELLAKITPENRHEEIDFGLPQGNELI